MNSNISDQLVQMVTLAQLQQQNLAAMGRNLSDLKEVIRKQAVNIDRLIQGMSEVGQNLVELRQISQEQAQTARQSASANA